MAPTVQTAESGPVSPLGRFEHWWQGSAPKLGCDGGLCCLRPPDCTLGLTALTVVPCCHPGISSACDGLDQRGRTRGAAGTSLTLTGLERRGPTRVRVR